jgi:hypothetical protein
MRVPGCERAWDKFIEKHPGCADPYALDEKAQPGMAGLDAYTAAPYLAWSGWRYRIPGGPIGGQYHGFIAPDDSIDGVGWPAGHDETFRPVDNPAGLGAFPWQGWDQTWGGIPLNEGETVSDYVYRGPAELRPRPNASGGTMTVSAAQTRRSAGYAIAPGNYKGIGALPPLATNTVRFLGPPVYAPGGGGLPPRVCPAWGCGPPPIHIVDGTPPGVVPTPPPPISPAPAPIVAQPPPPTGPGPAPVVAGRCPPGQYQDAAGNCTSDWRNPYVLYLPGDGSSPAPAPTVAANTCPSGYSLDQSTGNCVAPGTVGISAWLSGNTSIGGVQVPNFLLAAVGGLVALKFLGKR